MTRRPTEQQAKLERWKQEVLDRYPSFADELFNFLERDESTICYARAWHNQRHLSAVRIAPSPAITNQFDISLEIPVLIATFEGEFPLEPRVLKHLETSTELRKSTTADRDIAILVASDERARDYVRDRKQFSYPILVLLTDDLEAGKYRNTTLRTEIAKLMRSTNHFDYSNEITEAADFFGRISELEALTGLARTGQSVGIFGLRRAGKTSLLYRVAEVLKDQGAESVYVQLNAQSDADHFRESLVEATAQRLRQYEGEVPPNSEMLNGDFTIKTSPNVSRRWIYEMDALLDQLNRDLVILIDETDLANEDAADLDDIDFEERKSMNRVLQQLRGLIQIRNDRGTHQLSFLSAGVAASVYSTAVRFGRDNQLFGFASVRPLGPMSRDEMRQMVRTLGKRSGLRFDGYEVFDSLFTEYGGHPHLTRQACSRVAEAVQERTDLPVPYHVELNDLQTAYKSTAEGSPANAAWQTFESFQRWYPNEASEIIHLLETGGSVAPEAATHAVEFGICSPDGSLRMGALRRTALRDVG